MSKKTNSNTRNKQNRRFSITLIVQARCSKFCMVVLINNTQNINKQTKLENK